MKYLLIIALLGLAGCVTQTGMTRPKEQVSLPIAMPGCFLVCIMHITVEDNDQGSEEDAP